MQSASFYIYLRYFEIYGNTHSELPLGVAAAAPSQPLFHQVLAGCCTSRAEQRRPRRWSCRAPPMATTQYASDGRRLPRGWVELLDEEGSVYYWHTKKDERLFPPDFP